MSERDSDEKQDQELARVRGLILARRARFVAAALAGLGMSGACASPSVCLEPAIDAGGEQDAGVPPAPDAGAPPELDAGALKDAAPRVCLTPIE